MNYATLESVKETLELAGESFADPDLELAIDAASRQIEYETGRRFWVDETPTIQYFTALYPGSVSVGDLIQLDELATDSSGDGTYDRLWGASEYLLTPANAAGAMQPWTRLKARGMDFPTTLQAIRVTGLFGWSEVPAQIKQACVILAGRLMRRSREAPLGVAGFGADGAAVRISSQDPDVAALLSPFQEIGFP